MSFQDWDFKLKNLWEQHLINKSSLNKEEAYLLFEELNKEFKQLKKQEPTDSLTGFIFYETWLSKLKESYDSETASLIMIDIDDFKKVNDQYGHLEGNHQLKLLADTIRKIWNSPKDLTCRFGGDEFLIFSSEAQNISHNKSLLLLDELNYRSISVSIGIGKLSKLDELLKTIENTDKAMYQSKFAGKKQITLSGILKDEVILNFESKQI